MKTKIISSIFSCLLILGMMIPEAAVAGGNGKALDYKLTSNGTVIEIAFDSNSDGFNANVATQSAKGTFGQSDSVVLTEFRPPLVPVTGLCETDEYLYLEVLFSKGVITYTNGDELITSSGSGYICLNFATGDYEGLLEGGFDGGTGRFEYAHGPVESRFSGRNLTFPDGIPLGFATINGVTTGTLYLK